MRVLFDYQAFELQPIGGVSRLFSEITSHLRDLGIDATVGLKESDNAYVHKLGIAIKPEGYAHERYFNGKQFVPGQKKITRIVLKALGYRNELFSINQDYCIHYLKHKHIDIFEPTFYNPYFLPYLKGTPFTLEVHDMIPELFPKYYPKDDFQIVNKQLLCSLASAIHVPSTNTKKDLVNILNIAPEKITVIGRGVPSIHIPNTVPPRLIDNPYLLYVGDRTKYKNFIPLLQELAILVQAEPDLHLLCTGHQFGDEEKKIIADLNLTEHVHHYYATHNNFYSLYHHSVAFIFPSSYEGFGLPILEAFTCGCPVMLNNASCFPEIGGDAALYFDIKRRGDFAEHVKALLHISNEDRLRIISLGRQQLEKNSWKQTAIKLKNIYDSI